MDDDQKQVWKDKAKEIRNLPLYRSFQIVERKVKKNQEEITPAILQYRNMLIILMLKMVDLY